MASNYEDPLEKLNYPDRVNYANGVLLDEGDFRAEQAYHRGRLGRVLSYLHGFGTVAGLYVDTFPSDPHIIRVMPGLAVDRLGRLIEMSVPYCIRAQKWFEAQKQDVLAESYGSSQMVENGPQAVVADLFIKFNTCERGKTPCFGVGNVDATDAFIADRLRDGATLDLIIRTQPSWPVELKPRQKQPYEEILKKLQEHPNLIKELEKNETVRKELEEILSRLSTGTLNSHDAKTLLFFIKTEAGWREDDFWNSSNGKINVGNEYSVDQDGTEVLLARIRLPATNNPIPATNNPMRYDTNGEIKIQNDIRVLSLSTEELFWLIKVTRGA